MLPIENGPKRQFSHKKMDSNPTNGSDATVLSDPQEVAAGKVRKIRLQNFMCHESLEISLNEKMNIIAGQHGSGKSTILTALALGLGAKISQSSKEINWEDSEFVQEGKATAKIEITLSNIGANAYRPNVYGETITICRSLGLKDTYEIKNSSGQTISSAMFELKDILDELNIQIDNPMSILDENLAQEFLIGSDASKWYQMFLLANNLDDIRQKLEDSETSADHMETILKEYYEFLELIEKDQENLQKNITRFDEENKDEQQQPKIEKDWYKVAAKQLKDFRSALVARKIINQNDLAELRKSYNDLQDILQEKVVEKERLEKDQLRALQEKMTLAQLLLEKNMVALDDQSDFATLVEQQLNDSMAIYGPEMPRLLKRIDEEYAKGNFKKKPHGPLGAYFKLKDERWVSAVERYLDQMFIKTFCVDNEYDSTILETIMKENSDTITKDPSPIFVSFSSFSDQMVDTSLTGCYLTKYENILSVLEISDPVVGNCLINSQNIESVLLIPTYEEAKEVMSDQSKVPKNCKKAITLDRTILYPYPNFKAYQASDKFEAKYLRVSTDQVVRKFEEELNQAQDVKEVVEQLFNSQTERIARYHRASSEVFAKEEELSKLGQIVEGFQCEQKSILTLISDVDDLADELLQLRIGPETDVNECVEFMKKLQDLKIDSYDDAQKEEVESEIDQVESYENLKQQLIARKDKIKIISENIQILEQNIIEQKESSKMYKEQFETLRDQAVQKVQDSFQEILRFNSYRGSITFDHSKQTIEVEINPANDAEALPAASMAMVSFIMTLWDVTNLPFYFLDEFDVLMDMGDRQKIMDILLEYTKRCPHKQFGFLTPLDTAHLVSDDSVSIHRLAVPRVNNRLNQWVTVADI